MNTGAVKGLTISDLVPPGVIWEHAGLVVPTGWLLCDGSAVSRSQYPNLFRAIGVQHGAGNGSTTFNLPNRKGVVGVGQDTGQTEFAAMAQGGGYKDKTVSHTHDLQNHSHSRTPAGPSGDTAGVDSTAGWNGWVNAQGWYGETQDHLHTGETHGLGGQSGDGKQGWADGDQHRGIQTTDRSGQTTVAWGGPCPTGANTTTQDHTHGLENHSHYTPNHSHDFAHTHGDTYSTPLNNTTGGSTAAATSGNLQPYIVMNYIVKY
jgi:microcystin-dependent protein